MKYRHENSNNQLVIYRKGNFASSLQSYGLLLHSEQMINDGNGNVIELIQNNLPAQISPDQITSQSGGYDTAIDWAGNGHVTNNDFHRNFFALSAGLYQINICGSFAYTRSNTEVVQKVRLGYLRHASGGGSYNFYTHYFPVEQGYADGGDQVQSFNCSFICDLRSYNGQYIDITPIMYWSRNYTTIVVPQFYRSSGGAAIVPTFNEMIIEVKKMSAWQAGTASWKK